MSLITSPEPVRVETLDTNSMGDERLLLETFGRVAMGVQPLNQWAPAFSNPELMGLPGLRCKTFSVWFPTMIDFLGEAAPQIDQLRDEVVSRGIEAPDLFALSDRIRAGMVNLIRLFTREEQLFIYDRRVQNVHDLVSIFFRETVTVRWFSSEHGVVVRGRLVAEEYHAAIRPFYRNMQQSELDLLSRCVTGDHWIDLGRLAQGEGSIGQLVEMAGPRTANNET